MHPSLNFALAQSRAADLQRQASERRRPVAARQRRVVTYDYVIPIVRELPRPSRGDDPAGLW
jgi:hypothetical protein